MVRATLIVASDEDGGRTEITVPLVNAPTFNSEADAITHAIGNGQSWVKENG
ncbi:hypothetical protein J7E49_06965 [Variovorax paradoxus]|nr:hypothetical protein [Variovorax paradoxus]